MSDVATFTWVPDWVGTRKEKTQHLIDYDDIGLAGSKSETGRYDTVRIYQEAQFTFNRTELSAFMAFWRARKGSYEEFIAPSLWTPGTATTGAPHAFDGSEGIGYVRFSNDKIQIQWITDAIAKVTAAFVQTINANQGKPYVYLYRFFVDDGSVDDEYLANWGVSIDHDGHTWNRARVQHTAIEENIEPQKEKCKLEIDIRDCTLLRYLIQRKLDSKLWVQIVELDMSTGDSWDYFSGRIGLISRTGYIAKPTANLWGGMMNRQLPSQLISRTCHYCLFDDGCRRINASSMAASLWPSSGKYVETWTGSEKKVIMDNLSLNSRYSSYIAANPNPNQTSEGIYNWGYWYGGYAVTGTGLNRQVRPITFSAHTTSDRVHIIPLRPFRTGSGWLEVGDTITFWPGCDGNYSTCTDKFSNGSAFPGQPFVPAYIVEAAASSSSSSSK